MTPHRRKPPRSRVIPSDDETAASIRKQMAGKPDSEINAAVSQELRERHDVQRYVARGYHTGPNRTYTPPETD